MEEEGGFESEYYTKLKAILKAFKLIKSKKVIFKIFRKCSVRFLFQIYRTYETLSGTSSNDIHSEN